MGFRSKQLTLLTTVSLSHKLGCKRQNGKSKNIPNYSGQEGSLLREHWPGYNLCKP